MEEKVMLNLISKQFNSPDRTLFHYWESGICHGKLNKILDLNKL